VTKSLLLTKKDEGRADSHRKRKASDEEVLALRLARAQTDKLFSLVYSDFLYERPVSERHRLIFYLGHVDAFDWNHIARWELSERPFEPAFDQLFEAGIDPGHDQLPGDSASDWPEVELVQRYCAKTRARLDEIAWNASSDIVNMAVEHRLMHAETLSYLLHNMPHRQKRPIPMAPYPRIAGLPQRMIQIPEGSATLGAERGAQFGWDNEFDRHTVDVPRFAIQRRKVTNGDYLAFVQQGATPPHFWVKDGGKWYFRGMFGRLPLPVDAPVYVTHQEATAYASAQRKKLPTEAQFHRAAYGTSSGQERQYPWGSAPPTRAHGNFDFHHWHPVPCDATPAGESAFGVTQLVGNGWEWTSTVFEPFPGFTAAPNYPGYSANFFDGAHYVLKGASPRTAGCFLRRSFRNWFRPIYPHVYATFRCVED
jgi:formylglycine-generating enzyme required for sulfatase activity